MLKLVILHGDNTIESYRRYIKYLETAKARGWDIIRISKDSHDLAELLVSKGLFEKEKLLLINDINTVDKKSWSWVKKNINKLEANILIYDSGTLSQTSLKSLPKAYKIEEFKLPKLIWSFLDCLYVGNARNALLLLHEVVKKEPVEFVFPLLASHFRDLYWAKIDPASLPYPPWRVGKLKRQTAKFSKSLLKSIIKDLSKADIKAKTSKADLIDLLDFIIATKLE